MARRTVQTAKKGSWNMMSKYIRARDCFRDTRGFEIGNCVTCGKPVAFNDANAGHFISRVKTSVMFDERNVHLQCVYCNKYKGGNGEKYFPFMLKRYGLKVIEELTARENDIVIESIEYYDEKKKYYKDKLLKLNYEI